ncbi:repetitive organellar protein-like isoform X2 [Achroia grisella]|uniref:repetitive organellar protein-like isoform X2 n=1 Tax=Achroia grisella TaxID=688607 RepID=UPI0027D2C5D8|nr:repetitive organellar protein-like isoform X2 [Achroia grisella]
MDENDSSLDIEFKRYLQILRPYLGLLRDQYVIKLCNAWIQRLSSCTEEEKGLRNKYIFALCYQLARGALEDPFFKYPIDGSLQPLPDESYSDDSSTEIEYINEHKDDTKILFDNTKSLVSDTLYRNLSQDVELDVFSRNKDNGYENKTGNLKSHIPIHNQNVFCYTCPEIINKISNFDCQEENYEFRTKNLINKLREIKAENMLLRNELITLKNESKIKSDFKELADDIIKVDNTTSAYFHINESKSTVSLKSKLQEVQNSKRNLIQTIELLQEKLDNYDEMKRHEIGDIETSHRLELIAAKSEVKDEIMEAYRNKFEEQKYNYEIKIKDIEHKLICEKMDICTTKDNIITEKDKLIQQKDSEIIQLQNLVESQKKQLETIFKKSLEDPKDDTYTENMKSKIDQLEKRLFKAEKAKTKCIRIYEAKIVQLQREKHMTECSLQLQLAKQRTQIIDEISDENQTNLVSALDKLEIKYKDIVANVQTTAIQQRLNDQVTLESLIQKSCGVQNETMCGNCIRGTNHSQYSGTRRMDLVV